MSSYQNLIHTISGRHNDKIKKACAPLFQCYNLNYFYYYKISNTGYFTGLVNNIECSLCNTDQKLYLTYPFYHHPKHIQSGVILSSEVKTNPFPEILNLAKKNFRLNQVFMIITKSEGGFEEFGFGSSSTNELHNTMLLNELPLLRLFIKKFRQENQCLFSLMEESQIDLATLIGPAFHEKVLPELPIPIAKRDFLQKMGIAIENEPTQREAELIKWLLKGYSASQIALKLHLSKRTIEHRIERLKEKLGCYSKAELIEKSQELVHFGLY